MGSLISFVWREGVETVFFVLLSVTADIAPGYAAVPVATQTGQMALAPQAVYWDTGNQFSR